MKRYFTRYLAAGVARPFLLVSARDIKATARRALANREAFLARALREVAKRAHPDPKEPAHIGGDPQRAGDPQRRVPCSALPRSRRRAPGVHVRGARKEGAHGLRGDGRADPRTGCRLAYAPLSRDPRSGLRPRVGPRGLVGRRPRGAQDDVLHRRRRPCRSDAFQAHVQPRRLADVPRRDHGGALRRRASHARMPRRAGLLRRARGARVLRRRHELRAVGNGVPGLLSRAMPRHRAGGARGGGAAGSGDARGGQQPLARIPRRVDGRLRHAVLPGRRAGVPEAPDQDPAHGPRRGSSTCYARTRHARRWGTTAPRRGLWPTVG